MLRGMYTALRGMRMIYNAKYWKYTTLVSIVISVTDSIGYHSLHGSIMGCSFRVTRAGVAGWECEC